MAGSLSSLVTEVLTYLTPLWPGLQAYIGEEHAAKHNSPPRLIFIPTSDTFSGAKLQKVEPRPVRTRVANVSVHVWARHDGPLRTPIAAPLPLSATDAGLADLEATERLLNDLVAGIHQAAYGNYQAVGCRWVVPATGQLGRACIFDFTLEIPVTVQELQTVIAQITPETVILQLPSGPSGTVTTP